MGLGNEEGGRGNEKVANDLRHLEFLTAAKGISGYEYGWMTFTAHGHTDSQKDTQATTRTDTNDATRKTGLQ